MNFIETLIAYVKAIIDFVKTVLAALGVTLDSGADQPSVPVEEA